MSNLHNALTVTAGGRQRVSHSLPPRITEATGVGSRRAAPPSSSRHAEIGQTLGCEVSRLARREPIPIEIDTPVSTLQMAELLLENHAGL